MAKPTPAQAEVIRGFAGLGYTKQRVNGKTYEACERNGWIEATDVWPYHRTTTEGAVAIGIELPAAATTAPAPMQAELDAARDEALLEQPQQRNAQQMNPEYRIPQHVLDTDRALAEQDAAARAELGIPMHTEADDDPSDRSADAVAGRPVPCPTAFDRLDDDEQRAAVAGRVFAKGEGLDVAADDTRYRMRRARVGARRLDLFTEAGEFIGQAIEQAHGWALDYMTGLEPQLYADRFNYLDGMARREHARRGGSDGVSSVVVVGAAEVPAEGAQVGAVAPAGEVVPEVPAVAPVTAAAFVVEVNEGVVEASGQGAGWWHAYRARFRGTGRIRDTVPGCVVGGRAEVACDDQGDAEWLAGHMIGEGGLPRSAVRVKTAAR